MSVLPIRPIELKKKVEETVLPEMVMAINSLMESGYTATGVTLVRGTILDTAFGFWSPALSAKPASLCLM